MTSDNLALTQGTATSSSNMAPMRTASNVPLETLSAVCDTLRHWVDMVPDPNTCLQDSSNELKAIPGNSAEAVDEALKKEFMDDDEYESKVIDMIRVFIQWAQSNDRRSQSRLRRELLGSYFSPWCTNPIICKEYGSSLQARLDNVCYGEFLQTVPVKKSGIQRRPEKVPLEDHLDDNLLELTTTDSSSLVSRKDIAEARKLASSLPTMMFLGTADKLPFPTWRRHFNLQCKQYGLVGDPVATYYALVRDLSQSLLLSIDPTPPGVGPIQGWVDEVKRIYLRLSSTCSGISDDVAKLAADQTFSALRQNENETVSSFAARFFDGAADLSAYTGTDVSDEKLRTTFLRALVPAWRSVAMDLLPRCSSFPVLVQELTQRERLEQAVTGDKVTNPSTTTPNLHSVESTGSILPPHVSTVDDSSAPSRDKDRRGYHKSKKLCYQFQRTGSCKYGSKCRFVHDGKGAPSDTAKNGSLSFTQDLLCINDKPGSPGPVLRLEDKSYSNTYLYVLLDTGAYHNYIREDQAKLLGQPIEALNDSNVQVQLADKTVVPVRGQVMFAGYSFRVLPAVHPSTTVDSSVASLYGEPYAIMGVYSLCQNGIGMQFFQNDGSRSVRVSVKSPEGVSVPSTKTNANMSNPPVMDQVGNVLGEVIGDFNLSEAVDTSLHDDSWGSVSWVPNLGESPGISETPWRAMKDAPGFRWRVEKLSSEDSADTPTQAYKFVIDLPDTDTNGRPSYDYTKPLFDGLNKSEMSAYDNEISRYLERSWWQPCNDSGEAKTGVSRLHSSTDGLLVFPLPSPGRTTACRPVVDARQENRGLPRATYHGPTCSQILQSVRLNWRSREKSRILTLDGAQAFYRLHTSRPLLLKSNSRTFSSSRLVFGLNVGPCSLFVCLNDYLLQKAYAALSPADQERLQQCSLLYIYLDDITILCWGDCSGPVSRLIAQIERVGGLLGFEFPQAKRNDTKTYDDGKTFKHLGMLWQVAEDRLVLQCKKFTFSSALLNASQWTKRSLFAAAGCASTGSDPLYQHAETRALGDLLRRIAGSKSTAWDKALPLSTREHEVVLDALNRLYVLLNEPCNHSVAFDPPRELLCFTDASSTGGAWVVQAVSEENQDVSSPSATANGSAWLLGSSSFFWKGSQLSYHINRLELLAFARFILWLADVLGSHPPSNLVKVALSCDSKIALTWVRNGKASSKSMERVAVKRMINNINELLCSISDLGIQVMFRKVSGKSNVEADHLSRLAQDWKIEDIVTNKSTSSVERPAAEGHAAHYVNSVNPVGDQQFCQTEDSALVKDDDNFPVCDDLRNRIQDAQKVSPSLSPILDSVQGTIKSSSTTSTKYQLYRICNGMLNQLKYPHGDPLSSPRLVVCVPTDTLDGAKVADELIESYHVNNGHICPRFVRWRISRHFMIPDITHRTKVICRRCATCQASATRRVFTEYGGHLDASAKGVWRHISTDLAGPLPLSKPHRYAYAMIVIDDFSKFVFWRGLTTCTSAETTSSLVNLFEEVGIPRQLRCDNGPSYRSRLFRNAMEKLGVVVSPVNPFAPWSNGLAERGVSSLKSLFRRMLADGNKSSNWEHLLAKATRKSNTKLLSSGTSPFQLFYGREFFDEPAMKLRIDNDPYQLDSYKVDDARAEIRDIYTKVLEDREYVPRPRRRPAVGSTVQIYREDKVGKSHYGDTKYNVVNYDGMTATLRPIDGGDEKFEHFRNLRVCY